MNGLGDAVVAEARGWIGTPYVHQAATRDAGTDCLGLLRGVWRGIYGSEPESAPAYSPDWSEASRDERLWRAAERFLVGKLTTRIELGDVLLFRMRDGGVAKHLGIATETERTPYFVHAYTGHGVIESPLSAPWRRRIVAVFEFPERG